MDKCCWVSQYECTNHPEVYFLVTYFFGNKDVRSYCSEHAKALSFNKLNAVELSYEEALTYQILSE